MLVYVFRYIEPISMFIALVLYFGWWVVLEEIPNYTASQMLTDLTLYAVVYMIMSIALHMLLPRFITVEQLIKHNILNIDNYDYYATRFNLKSLDELELMCGQPIETTSCLLKVLDEIR